MSRPDRITVSRSKRGTTIKASGRAAQALFDAMTRGVDKPPADGIEIAWCWRSGLIDFGTRMPQGAIEIVRGPDRLLRDTVGAMARHGIGASAGKLLVPGIPEAADDEAASDALEAFTRRGRGASHPALDWNTPKD